MTRIAIVEDEAAVREQLAGYVQRYTRQYGTPFEVTEFADGMEILEDYRPQFDIIFLDVEMKHLDGMETARRIRERDGGVLIVFITNMAQYAIRGYAVGALDYVLKPVPYFAFLRSSCKRRWGSWKSGSGITWPWRWTAACGGWTRRKSITWKRRPQGAFYTEKEDFMVSGHPEKTMRKAGWAGAFHGWHEQVSCQSCAGFRRAAGYGAGWSVYAADQPPAAQGLYGGLADILGVRDSDDIAGYSPPVHRFGGSAGGAAVCAQAAAADGSARDLGRRSRLGGAAGAFLQPRGKFRWRGGSPAWQWRFFPCCVFVGHTQHYAAGSGLCVRASLYFGGAGGQRGMAAALRAVAAARRGGAAFAAAVGGGVRRHFLPPAVLWRTAAPVRPGS